MRRWLSSPRRRRRLAWTLGPLLVVGGFVVALIAFGGHGRVIEPDLKLTGDAQVYVPPREVRLTREQRATADRTLHEFVSAAVLREDPATAWRLSSPELRAGVTRSDWDRGDMPVQPYPARLDRMSWRIEKAYADHVELDVLLFPQAGSDQRPMSIAAELKPVRRTWEVSYWYPRRALAAGADATATATKEAKPEAAPTAPARDTNTGRLGHAYFLVPVAIFAIVVLVPLAILLATWYRGKRAYARYSKSRT